MSWLRHQPSVGSNVAAACQFVVKLKNRQKGSNKAKNDNNNDNNEV